MHKIPQRRFDEKDSLLLHGNGLNGTVSVSNADLAPQLYSLFEDQRIVCWLTFIVYT